MLDLKRIGKARKRISEVISKTPFAYAPILSEISGYEIYLKKENLQRTGSFKLRGAFNKIATLIEEGRKNGVVAASAGNHAQGVAFASKHFNIDATMGGFTPMVVIPWNWISDRVFDFSLSSNAVIGGSWILDLGLCRVFNNVNLSTVLWYIMSNIPPPVNYNIMTLLFKFKIKF